MAFFFFLKVKYVLKGTHFKSVYAGKRKTADVFKIADENWSALCVRPVENKTAFCVCMATILKARSIKIKYKGNKQTHK